MMDHLNADVLRMIFVHLNQKDLYSCMRVCKTWRRALTQGPGALLEKQVFRRLLTEKDQRLDTGVPWRLLVTPMVKEAEENEWVYGHAFSRKIHMMYKNIDPPYCTWSSQNTIYRRNSPGLMPVTQPNDKKRPDMPLLHKRHRMMCPAYVKEIRLVAILNISQQNYKELFLTKEVEQKLQGALFVAKKDNVENLQRTRLLVTMKHRSMNPTENTKEAFEVLKILMEKFPKILVETRWIEADAFVPKLPRPCLYRKKPFQESASIVRIMPIPTAQAREHLDKSISNVANSAGEKLQKWLEDGLPWDMFGLMSAVKIAMCIFSEEQQLSASQLAANILVNDQMNIMKAHWKCMRCQGFTLDPFDLDTPVLLNIIVVFFYYTREGIDRGFTPFCRQKRTIEMQRLVESVLRGGFVEKNRFVTRSSIQDHLKQFVGNLSAKLPHWIATEYEKLTRGGTFVM